jgi:VanZ family protein|tara:strand:- start:13424 stop:13705 length:282 start_codon:yes stop_codon:yes gene_type:complete
MWQIDVLIHASYYFALTITGFYILQHKKINPLLLITLLFSFSVVLELLQFFIPKRSIDLMDIASNAIGLVLGWLTYRWLLKNKLNLKNTDGVS